MAPRTPHRGRRRLLAAASLAVGAVVADGLRRRHPALDPVADDLRSPLLYLPLSLRGPGALRVMRSIPAPAPPARRGVSVESRSITTGDGRSLRLVVYERPDRPASEPGRVGGGEAGDHGAGGVGRPALVWIHGGGMILGRPEQGHELCCRWADELGMLVVSVDYRLAPEHPCPAGLEDCYEALSWLHRGSADLGVDPARIAVGGDSAGGGLAAALSQLARDRHGPPICFQLLEYPMLDDRTVLDDDHGGRGRFVWTPASNRFAWTAYLGHPPRWSDAPPYAAPSRASDLSGLPPAWVGVGALDLFRDEDADYAARLEAAGVGCQLHVEPGMYHGADSVLAQAPTSRRFRDRMTQALAEGVAVARSAGAAPS